MKDVPGLIAADPAYRWFLVVQMLATSARIATPFYILHVGATMHLDGATLGLLSLAFLGADTVSNIAWGYLGDRSGFRIVLLLAIIGLDRRDPAADDPRHTPMCGVLRLLRSGRRPGRLHAWPPRP
jgi:MFS family permease